MNIHKLIQTIHVNNDRPCAEYNDGRTKENKRERDREGERGREREREGER